MKKFTPKHLLFFLFTLLLISSCEDEPLEGEFIDDACTSSANDGYIKATVGPTNFDALVVADGDWAYNAAIVVIHENGFRHLTIAGLDIDDGQIVIEIKNPAVGIHNLATNIELGIIGNENNHELLENYGSFAPNPDNYLEHPYVSYIPRDGFGQVDLTLFDEVNLLVSGTFTFNGNRVKTDPDTGEIEYDGNGNEIIEEVVVECGSFNNLPFTFIDSSSGGGGPIITNEFFAKVDDVDFNSASITTTSLNIGGVPMVKIVAIDENEELIRIDLPKDLGVGTFSMEQLSDGTKVIALYNPHTGGENLTSNPGTITITKFNNNTGVIEATFEFSASDPLGLDPTEAEITEGSFLIDYLFENGDELNDITAEVDGEFFNPDSITISNSTVNGIARINAVAINSETNQKLGLFFPENIEVGTFEMEANLITGEEKFGQFTPDIGASITYISIPGTLIITEFDLDSGIIEGTFTFNAVDQLNVDPTIFEITNGEFILDIF